MTSTRSRACASTAACTSAAASCFAVIEARARLLSFERSLDATSPNGSVPRSRAALRRASRTLEERGFRRTAADELATVANLDVVRRHREPIERAAHRGTETERARRAPSQARGGGARPAVFRDACRREPVSCTSPWFRPEPSMRSSVLARTRALKPARPQRGSTARMTGR